MNPEETIPPVPATGSGAAAGAARPTRPFYWSVRRELWESRTIWRALLVVAALVLLGSLLHLTRLPETMKSYPTLDAAERHLLVVQPFSLAPAPVMLVAFLVGLFYALDALYGERRDRSVLFWKSLPVSDLTTVLAKASIPLVVLPALALALSWVTFAALVLAGTLMLSASGMSPSPLWAELSLVEGPLVMLYGLTVHSLWFAPIYTWVLLVSAWARRLPVLWVVLPPVAVGAVEKLALGSSHFASFLCYRLSGAMKEAFVLTPGSGDAGLIDRLAQLDPRRFLGSPGLWTGLVFAAGCLALAARLRRTREPN